MNLTAWQLLFTVLMAILTGCSKPKPALEYNSGQALQTLTTALDAWKQGQANQLITAVPPIRFVDDDLVEGWQLIDYQPPEKGTGLAPYDDIPVALVSRDTRGKIVRKTATYQVGLSPLLTVLRSDR